MKPALLFAFALSSCLPPTGGAYEGTSLERALDSTVVLGHVSPLTGETRLHCAGVIVEQVVVTANHCVDDIPDGDLRVALRGEEEGTWYAATVLSADSSQDIAVIQVARHLRPGVRVAYEDPRYLDRLVVIGHPWGLRWSVYQGRVSHPWRSSDGASPVLDWLQVDAPFDPGNSGGPVFDRYGDLVGIVSFSAGRQGGAVHVSAVRDILASVGLHTRP